MNRKQSMIEDIYFFDEKNNDFSTDSMFLDDEPTKKVEKVPEKPEKKTAKEIDDELTENILFLLVGFLFLVVFVGCLIGYTTWYFNN